MLVPTFLPRLSSDFSCHEYTFEWEIGPQTWGKNLNCTAFDGESLLRGDKFDL
jgi:hypothetical protein